MERTLITLLAGSVVSLLGKGAWDYFKSGQVEKASIYVTKSECLSTVQRCNLPNVKDQLSDVKSKLESFKAEMKARMIDMEKRVEQSSLDIREFRDDISEIKSAQVKTHMLLETLLQNSKHEKLSGE